MIQARNFCKDDIPSLEKTENIICYCIASLEDGDVELVTNAVFEDRDIAYDVLNFICDIWADNGEDDCPFTIIPLHFVYSVMDFGDDKDESLVQ